MLNRCVTLNAGHEGEDSIDSDVSIDREDNIGHISINSGSPEEVEYNYTYLKDITFQQGAGVQVNGLMGLLVKEILKAQSQLLSRAVMSLSGWCVIHTKDPYRGAIFTFYNAFEPAKWKLIFCGISCAYLQVV